MAGIREVRLTTADGKDCALSVEYEYGTTHLIVPDQLAMSSPLEPAAAKLQVANLLKRLGADLQNIEPDLIIIEWRPSGTMG
jgi:hypothetical protein